MLARFACAVDDLSGGRLQFGVGAGWQEREHHNFSWDLLEIPDRMQRFEEALEIMTQLLRSGGPVTFEGQYYQVYDAVVLPRPARVGGPPIVIGGNGPKRTLPLAAKYANEWNAVYLTGDRFAERSDLLTALLEKQGRSAGDVRRTMMTGCVYSSSEKKLAERLESSGRKKEDLQSDGMIVGSGDDFTQQLKKLQDAGVQRVMLQWINLDDLDELSKMAELILPEFHL
jgi:alkanesulfonate monooxygenase SsuD/methylene tetrahydromethanopterin reductase-like flavin-dependent oxidoreductase (luciferase family)